MYKGKFDQAGNPDSVDIEQLLAQRREDAAKAAARKKSAKATPSSAASGQAALPPEPKGVPSPEASFPKETPSQKETASPKEAASPAKPVFSIEPSTATPSSPSSPAAPRRTAPSTPDPIEKRSAGRESPRQMPPASRSDIRPASDRKQAPSASRSSSKKKKKGPRLGGVIFYTVYFLFIALFFVATFVGLQYVRTWLVSYEAARPNAKAEQVFTQLFTDPDWEALYVASGAQDSPYEGKDAFVQYMREKVDPQKLTYMETSAGLSGNKKFVVRMGSERISAFTLADKNPDTSNSLTRIPDWQLSAVELYFQRQGTYRIEKLKGQVAYVNGVKLSEDLTIQEASTSAQEYLPAGVTLESTCIQEVSGIMVTPTVEVYDSDGNPQQVNYDADTQTFTVRKESSTMGEEEKAAALAAAEAECKWMIRELTGQNNLAKFFDSNSNAFKTLTSSELTWTQKNNGYTFLNETVTDYVRYSDSIFSARVSLTAEIKVQIDGSTKTIDFNKSMFFRKTSDDRWLCYESLNRDVSQLVGKIRLTFKQGDTTLLSTFFQTDAKQIITPVITAPEGKVFSGWVRQDTNEQGQTTLTVIFQPDETGTVSIREDAGLVPMTLYALFEDPISVSTVG